MGSFLIEGTVTYSTPKKVDPATGMLEGVKLLGWESKNKRKYPRAVIERFIDRYKDRASYYAHGSGERHFDDLAGNIRNPRIEADGLYGDVQVLMKDSRSAKLFEVAASMPHRIGMSHVAVGDGHRDSDGVLVVDTIDEVISIDIVTDPATTNGLFESIDRKGNATVKLKFRKLIENIEGKSKGNRAKWAKWLREESAAADAPVMSADVDAADADAGPEDMLKKGFRAAITKILDDDTLDMKSKMKQIADILKTEEKMLAKDDPEPPAESSSDSSSSDPPKNENRNRRTDDGNDDELRTLRERLDRSDRRESLRKFAASLKFTPSDDQMADYLTMSEEVAKRAIKREAQTATGPRMGGPRGSSDDRGSEKPLPTDSKTFKERVFSRN